LSDSARLSLYWFFSFAGLGVYFPYFSLYLRENAALDGTEVGLVLAVMPLVGAVLQPFWGQLADRTGARRAILALTTVCAAAGYLGLGYAHGFGALLVAAGLLSAFSSPIVPLLSSVSFAVLRDGGAQAFGRVRVWGTISFLLLVVAFPYGLHIYQRAGGLQPVAGGPSEPGLEIMFPVVAAFTLLAALASLTFPNAGAVALRARPRDWRRLLGHPPMRRLVAFTLLAYVFLHGPMLLFPVFVTARGGSIDTVGQMWVVMILLEIPLIAWAGASVRRIGAPGLLQLGVLLAGFRWLACGLSDDMPVIFAVQLVHAVAVAGLGIGAPLYLDALVPESLRSTGQSLLAFAGVGIGGVLSTIGSGWLLEHVGIDSVYLAGGAGAVVLSVVGRRWLAAPQRLVLADPEGSAL
jgi:MFS family permease